MIQDMHYFYNKLLLEKYNFECMHSMCCTLGLVEFAVIFLSPRFVCVCVQCACFSFLNFYHIQFAHNFSCCHNFRCDNFFLLLLSSSNKQFALNIVYEFHILSNRNVHEEKKSALNRSEINLSKIIRLKHEIKVPK